MQLRHFPRADTAYETNIRISFKLETLSIPQGSMKICRLVTIKVYLHYTKDF